MRLPAALAELELIDEFTFVVHPVVVGRGPRLLEEVREQVGLELVERREFATGLWCSGTGFKDSPAVSRLQCSQALLVGPNNQEPRSAFCRVGRGGVDDGDATRGVGVVWRLSRRDFRGGVWGIATAIRLHSAASVTGVELVQITVSAPRCRYGRDISRRHLAIVRRIIC